MAKAKDERVIEPLIKALQAESVWQLAVEAARSIGHPSLLPSLIELQSWWDVDPEALEEAIESCSKGTNELADGRSE